MEKILPLVPVSEVVRASKEVRQKIKSEPVLLTTKSEVYGILVDPEEWNKIVEKLRSIK